jgi:hypothetical protein
VFVAEGGIAQAEAERKQRLAIIVDILLLARRIGIVKVGKLPDVAGESNRQPTRWVVVAEERLCNRLAS